MVCLGSARPQILRERTRVAHISFVVSPIRDHAFFEQPCLERLFGDDLLQSRGLAAQTLHLVGRGSTGRIAGKAALAGFEELFGRCCQSDANSSLVVALILKPASGYAMRDCHSTRAAERRCLYSWRLTRWRSWLKWLWTLAWTLPNFCRVFICRNLSIARSRRRNGR